MPRNPAAEKIAALERLGNSHLRDFDTWFALVEDTVKQALPETSALMARFTELKAQTPGEQETGKNTSAKKTDDLRRHISSEYIPAVCDFLTPSATPAPSPDDLKDDVERIIQKGYFNSIYFRVILGLFSVLLLLVTGVGVFKVNEQVDAMRKLLDESKATVQKSAEEIATSSAAIKDQQAKFALFVLQGNQDLVTLQTKALVSITAQEDTVKSQIESKVKILNTDIDEAGGKAVKRIFDEADEQSKQDKKVLLDKLTATLGQLEASKHPAVPAIIWAMAKTWLIVPIVMYLSISTAILGIARYFDARPWIATVAAWLSLIVIVAGSIAVFRMA